MLAGTYQPLGLADDGSIKSQLTPVSYKRQMFQDFSTMYWRYVAQPGARLRMELEGRTPEADVDVNAWASLFTGGIIHSAFIACSGYKNVLVIPSWNDNAIRINRLCQSRDNSFVPYAGSGIHMFPLVHWYNECYANLTVATVRSADSFFDFMYKQYAGTTHLGRDNLTIARSDEYYRLGDENYFRHLKGTTEEKYDAVVLIDVPNGQDGRFNSYALKQDFAHLCTDDFDLIEFNTHTFTESHRIYNAKNVNAIIDKALGIITPQSLKKELVEEDGVLERRYRSTMEQSFKVQANHLKKKIRVY